MQYITSDDDTGSKSHHIDHYKGMSSIQTRVDIPATELYPTEQSWICL